MGIDMGIEDVKSAPLFEEEGRGQKAPLETFETFETCETFETLFPPRPILLTTCCLPSFFVPQLPSTLGTFDLNLNAKFLWAAAGPGLNRKFVYRFHRKYTRRRGGNEQEIREIAHS